MVDIRSDKIMILFMQQGNMYIVQLLQVFVLSELCIINGFLDSENLLLDTKFVFLCLMLSYLVSM